MKKRIHINRLGYMTGMPKAAICSSVSAGIFYIIDADRGVGVYAGRLSHPSFDRESGDTVRFADFSDFNTKGRYFIKAGYRRSDVFEINDSPYKQLRRRVLDGIYLNRCGYSFSPHDSRVPKGFCHAACHTETFSVRGKELDLSGGWHTRSGYSRETRLACISIADMIYSLKLFGGSFSETESTTIAGECIWGLDWLFKMQDSDGGIFSGIVEDDHFDMSHPNDDVTEYYLGKKSISAALRFTAAAALAAQYFSKSDTDYYKKLRKAAEKSWLWIIQSSEFSGFEKSVSCESEEEESEFMWALCEMYSMTGDESFSVMIRQKYMSFRNIGFGNGSCGGFASLSYLLSDRVHERDVEAVMRKHIIDHADRMCIAVRSSGYRTARSAGGGYVIGSNFHILCDCMAFITAYLISGDNKYLIGATDQFSYILGRNPLGMVYVTGESDSGCQSPCHGLSFYSSENRAVRGMVVGGPTTERTDEYSKWHIDKNAPPAKCYLDDTYSISTNSAAVHYGTPLIFISAFYDKVGRSALAGMRKTRT